MVGQQITIDESSSADQLQRLELLVVRAVVTQPREECDLVVRGILDAMRYSAVLLEAGVYLDTNGIETSPAALREQAMASGNVLTFTCVPPGSGARLALDRGAP